MRLSSSPIVATAFIALLNVVAVALCYGLSRKMFAPLGERAWLAALIAALLFAVAPWAVIHSRKVWAQDLLPFFVMLYVWFGYRAFVQRKAWSLIGHGVALAATDSDSLLGVVADPGQRGVADRFCAPSATRAADRHCRDRSRGLRALRHRRWAARLAECDAAARS